MKRWVVLIFYLLFYYCGIAQNTYIKTHYLNNNPPVSYVGVFNKILPNSNGFTIFGANSILEVDSLGNILSDSVYQNSNYPLSWKDGLQLNLSRQVFIGDGGMLMIKNVVIGEQLINRYYFDSIGYSILSLISIAQTTDKNYYIMGQLDITVPPSYSDHRFLLLKTDSIGNLFWAKTYFVDNPTYTFKLFRFIVNSGNNLLIGGSLSLPNTNSFTTITKIDTLGNVIWAKRTTIEDNYAMNDMLLNDDGSLTLLRKESGKWAGLSKVDSAGNILWSKSYGGSSWCFGRALTKTSDGGYAIVSSVNGTFPGWTNDGIGLLKTDSIGNLQWRHDYSDSNTRAVRSVAQTADGGYIIAGSQSNPNGGSDGLLIKTDSSGHVGSCYETTPPYFTQSFADSTVDIQVIVGNIELRDTTLTIYPDTSGTFTTLCETVGIEEQTLTYSPTTYPNPFTATLTVTHPAAKGSIFITDITGKEVYRTTFTNSTMQQLQLTWLQPGMYFLTVTTNGVASTKKIIKL